MMIGGNPDIGGFERFRTWPGQIDDVALWSRVLTPTEIAYIRNGGTGRTIAAAGGVVVNVPTPVLGPFGFDGNGDYAMPVGGLLINKSYQLRRTTTLNGTDWVDIGPPFTGATTHTFVDDNPPAGKAFYSIFYTSP